MPPGAMIQLDNPAPAVPNAVPQEQGSDVKNSVKKNESEELRGWKRVKENLGLVIKYGYKEGILKDDSDDKKSNASINFTKLEGFDDIRGWDRVKLQLPRIIVYGRKKGLLPPVEINGAAAQIGFAKMIKQAEKAINQQGDKVHIPNDHDDSIHAAIPFLPIPAAVPCFILNILMAGSGTALSGFLSMFCGQPRIQVKEGRGLASFVVNSLVGGFQFVTVALFLVGWFWSITWGGLILFHSMQYRDALIHRRKEAIAMAAIEALTKDSILHRREVMKIVKKEK